MGKKLMFTTLAPKDGTDLITLEQEVPLFLTWVRKRFAGI